MLTFTAVIIISGSTGGISAYLTLIAQLIWALTDALWIFKDGANHRLIDVICKTDVVDESKIIQE